MVMDNGIIEIGNIMTQASPDVINKLKSILDQHGIFHIFDGIIFNSPNNDGISKKVIQQDLVKELNHVMNYLPHDEQLLIDLENYQELILPGI